MVRFYNNILSNLLTVCYVMMSCGTLGLQKSSLNTIRTFATNSHIQISLTFLPSPLATICSVEYKDNSTIGFESPSPIDHSF